MSAVVKPEFEKRPRRRARLCRKRGKSAQYRSPSSRRLKSDRQHDLCTACFWRLVKRANEEQR
jgi:hypothetical protein